jgi:hypothetical protein
MAYVNIDKIQDRVVRRLIDTDSPLYTSRYSPLADRAVESLAQRRGVYTFTDIGQDDDGYITNIELEMYWINYFCMLVCQDSIGSNNVEISVQEVYMAKYDMYKSLVKDGKNEITKEMVLDCIDEIADTVVQSNLLFRN